MCLILIAHGAHADFPLVIAANRDEYYERPTAKAEFWEDHPHILAGRDLECMGTWLGVTRRGRFAALTNFRDPRERKSDAPSRGQLVRDFLTSEQDPREYFGNVANEAPRYNGFNLLAGDIDGVFYFSSRTGVTQRVAPGIHGLSNHLLDTPWPKVQRAKSRLATALAALPDTSALLELLRDDTPAADAQLPRTGVSIEHERMLSSAFIRGEHYGTRSSTVVTIGSDRGVSFGEWSWNRAGALDGNAQFGFDLEPTG